MPKAHTHKHKIFCLFIYLYGFCFVFSLSFFSLSKIGVEQQNLFYRRIIIIFTNEKNNNRELNIQIFFNGPRCSKVNEKKLYTFLFFPFEFRSILMPIEYKNMQNNFFRVLFFCTEQAKSSVTQSQSHSASETV